MAQKVACSDIKAKFDAMDLDKSGLISRQELVTIIISLREARGDSDCENNAKADVHAIMKSCDENADGKISWEEFEKAYGSS